MSIQAHPNVSCGDMFHQGGLQMHDLAPVEMNRCHMPNDGFPNVPSNVHQSVLPPHVCNDCNERFSSKEELQKHSLCHASNQKHVCDICNKSFGKKEQLDEHALIHTNENPYVCDICNKGFTEKNNLLAHLLTHAKERPFVCDVCSKAFTEKSQLKKHLSIHNKERCNMCEICDRTFKRKGFLENHMLLHAKGQVDPDDPNSKPPPKKVTPKKPPKPKKEKPYSCELCPKSFIRRGFLEQHQLTYHTGKKPHECHFCGRDFTRKNDLMKHMTVIHTQEKNHICHLCSKAFAHKTYLQRHLNVHAKEKAMCSSGQPAKRRTSTHVRAPPAPPVNTEVYNVGGMVKQPNENKNKPMGEWHAENPSSNYILPLTRWETSYMW